MSQIRFDRWDALQERRNGLSIAGVSGGSDVVPLGKSRVSSIRQSAFGYTGKHAY